MGTIDIFFVKMASGLKKIPAFLKPNIYYPLPIMSAL
jgi:hypothetical protein